MSAARPAPLPLLAIALASLAVVGVLFALYVHPAYAQNGSEPAKPTGLTGTATHDSITLAWDDPDEDSITGYVVLRRNRNTTESGQFSELVADTGTAATTYTDDTVEANTPYTYRIKAINERGASERSHWLDIDTLPAPVPTKPTGLTATATHEQVVLTWDDPQDDSITGYVILRRVRDNDTGGEFNELVADTGNAATTYTDDTVPASTTHTYRIKAINAHGISERSRWFHIDTSPAPEPVNYPATGEPTISGTAQVGETLTANTSSIADEDGLDNTTFTHQWLADDAEIARDTGSSYTLLAADEGMTVTVKVRFTDDAGNDEALTSAATEAVAATEPGRPPAKPRGLSVGGPRGSGQGTVYTYEDGDRTIRVILQGDLVVQETSADTPSDDVARRAAGGNIVQRQFVRGGADLPVFHSASGGALMTLPGGVLLALDPEWDGARVNGFFAQNNISKARISQLDYVTNGFFVRTEPGFPSLELANALAAQKGVVVSSPNWWREVEARKDPGETKGDDRGATKEAGGIEPRNAGFASAYDLPLDGSYTERISPAWDIDYFKLDLSGQTGAIDVRIFTTDTLDTVGGLYNSDRDFLMGNDDSFGTRNFSLLASLSPGVYYVIVYSYEQRSTGSYTLHTETVTATNVSLGSSVAASIGAAAEVDYFKLDLSGQTGATDVRIFTTDTLDTVGGLYNSDRDFLMGNDDSFGTLNFSLLASLSPGVYYMIVYSYEQRSTGSYTLHTETVTATNVSLGSSVAASIGAAAEVDYFKLDLWRQTGDTDVSLFTFSDDLVLELEIDSGSWAGLGNVDALGDAKRVVHWSGSSLSPGVYLVGVWSPVGDTGDYSVRLATVPDHGGTTATATDLSLDAPTSGKITSASDADYFELELTAAKNLAIMAFPDVNVVMLDSGGIEITVNIEIGGRYNKIIDDFASGTYYVKITAPYASSSSPVYYALYAYEDTGYGQWVADCADATNALGGSHSTTDPLYACQWHLSSADSAIMDINVESVWADESIAGGITGAGANVVVVDNTIDYSHEDLTDNIDSSLNHDYGGRSGAYRRAEHHGTNVAGVIAAQANDIGVRGVAPGATIYGYNILADGEAFSTDANEADAMARNRVVTAVSNNSWGPVDGYGLDHVPAIWKMAIDSGVTQGYAGKGVFYAWAGGNGDEYGDNSNFDEYANYYGVTAVCAVGDNGARATYSEQGANLWICAPSNGGARGIVTTENSDRYTNTFGGTSSATPTVAGVAALLLQANPDLTWRDLKLILAGSARQNDASNADWEEGARKYGLANHADRYHFNHEYGFGVVDVAAAVALAQDWSNLPEFQDDSEQSRTLTITIPDNDADGITHELTLDTDIDFTEFVAVEVSIEHDFWRDLRIEVVSPSGTVSTLAVAVTQEELAITRRGGLESTVSPGTFRFGSAKHLGENPNGAWQLRVADELAFDQGTLKSWSITVYGHVSRPGAPTITTPITVGAGSLTVAWSTPSDNGSQAITAYDLRYIQTSADETVDSNWTALEDVWTTGPGPLEYTITGLTDGTQYDVQVRAVNSAGGSAWSATATGTPTRATTGPCTTGVAVPTAASNPGLVADCEALLEARDTLAGSGPLNWSADTPIASWDGVTVDGSPLRVTKLVLRDSQLTGTIPPELGGLANLAELSLGDNRLTGPIPSELSNLTNLESLSLTQNQLTGPIPAGLSGLSNLKILVLGGNQLTGPIPTWLDSLTNLQELYLWGNQLTGPIPSELGSLTDLVGLDLRGNQLSGEIPSQLASLTNLQRLSLYDNQLSGPVPTWLGSLTNLELLYLSLNQLTGPIPSELGSLTNLQGLLLNDTQLTGTIPTELGSLANLENLSLTRNQLTGTIPPELSGLTSLETLAFGGNQLTGPVPTWLDSLTNLQGLYLWGNQLTGPIPSELGSLTNLERLELSGNQLTGQMPSQLASLTNLQHLSLYDNQLSGTVPTLLENLTNLERLNLSLNQLTGTIPSELGSLANLESLSLTGNQLTGTIPPELSGPTSLETLALGGNQLTGSVPTWLGSLTNLRGLYLWGNQLTGPIPSELGSLTNLERLELGGNQLTGQMPSQLASLTNLQHLSLYDNQMSGPVPTLLGNLTNLTSLILFDNQLTGQIPSSLGSLANLQELYLFGNQLTGTIPAELGNLANLTLLDLRGNQLSGEIPAELGNLDNLEVLSLSGNQLTGCIPVGIADVADNDFSELGLPFCGGARGSPTIGTLTAGANFLTVTWSAPVGSDGAAISAYDLRYIQTSADETVDANWTVVEDVWTTGSGALSYQISGLTGGTQYDLQVRAVTAAGEGSWSATATGTPATWGAVRSLSPPSVAPAGEVVVMITASGYGRLGRVTETLPPGFSYVSSSLPDSAVTASGREVRFRLLGETDFTYTVAAPGAAGTYFFSGVLRNSEREDVPVGGALTIAVAAGDPLVARYDANGNGEIDLDEVFTAIDDYFDYDDRLTLEEVFEIVDLYFES